MLGRCKKAQSQSTLLGIYLHFTVSVSSLWQTCLLSSPSSASGVAKLTPVRQDRHHSSPSPSSSYWKIRDLLEWFWILPPCSATFPVSSIISHFGQWITPPRRIFLRIKNIWPIYIIQFPVFFWGGRVLLLGDLRVWDHPRPPASSVYLQSRTTLQFFWIYRWDHP